MLGIGRREFITLLGDAAAAWPLGARAQQQQQQPVPVLDCLCFRRSRRKAGVES
jgi:hypothetical protein